jgi:DNA polymerase III alpha subunit
VLKDGRGLMKFLTLEDPGGTFEAVVFPEPYQQYGRLFTSLGPFLLTGDVRCEHDACALIVHHVERVGRDRETTAPTMHG